MEPLEYQAKQAAYAAQRLAHTNAWRVCDEEDFCVRKEVCPRTGKWLIDLERKNLQQL